MYIYNVFYQFAIETIDTIEFYLKLSCAYTACLVTLVQNISLAFPLRPGTFKTVEIGSNPLLRRMDRQLSDHKRRLRERNPRLDATLIFWEYGPTRPLTPTAGAIFNQMLNDSYKSE